MNNITLTVLLFLLLQSCGVDKSTQPDRGEDFANQVKINIPAQESLQADTSITLDFLMGKFDVSKHPDFIKIKPEHCSRENMYLQKESYEAFTKMYEVAKKDGINFTIMSATRSFDVQKGIWEAKWDGKRKSGDELLPASLTDPIERALKILRWSSMPGSSRHHWGTDIDLNNFTNSYFEEGQGLKEYQWLLANARSFGFCQPYTTKGPDRPDGYNEEKWHWSYYPLSSKYTDQAELRLKNEAISGFKGSDVADQIGVVKKYILGINHECRKTVSN